MKKEQFIEEVFEVAFGDNAINRDFSYEEVIQELKLAYKMIQDGIEEDDY